MKNRLLNNWQIKLTCLLLAAAIWYVIKQNVTSPLGLPDRRPPATWQKPNS